MYDVIKVCKVYIDLFNITHMSFQNNPFDWE